MWILVLRCPYKGSKISRHKDQFSWNYWENSTKIPIENNHRKITWVGGLTHSRSQHELPHEPYTLYVVNSYTNTDINKNCRRLLNLTRKKTL